MRLFEGGLNAFYIMIRLKVYGGQGVEYGHLNENGTHRPTGNGRCGLVGGVILLEEMCHWTRQAQCHSLFLLPANRDVDLSAPSPALCLPVHSHVSHHDNNDL